MRSSQLSGSRRSQKLRGAGLTLALAMALVGACMGCDDSAPQALPDLSERKHPAEQDLDRVKDRLKHAIQEAQPARDSGVVSQRDLYVRLIPPAGDEQRYTAEVTIETTSKLAKSKIPPRARRPPPPKPSDDDELGAAEPAPPEDKGDELVAASETHRTETFHLVYEDQRWKLQGEPKERIDRIFFDYALSD